MTKLSVNINKIATIRNSRGKNYPSIIEAAIKCQKFGAQGITIHPRPDERHITRKDVFDLKPVIVTEFNIEGNPTMEFIDLILKIKPTRVTLVPDLETQITSNHGWNLKKNFNFLSDIILDLHHHNIKTSIFLNPDLEYIEMASKIGTDRIELYTGFFAEEYPKNPKKSIKKYIKCANVAFLEYGLEVSAGHDLSLSNIEFLLKQIPIITEVSIGHALISEALYFGLHNTIQFYLKKIYNVFHSNSLTKKY